MNRIALTLIGAAALALGACSNGTSDTLSSGGNTDPNSTAGGENTTFDHSNDSMAASGADNNSQGTDPGQVKIEGTPEVTALLHGCGKLTVTSLANFIATRGITGKVAVPTGSMSGAAIFKANGTPAALGAANYSGRVGESPFSSTSAMSKMYDIFTMSSYDIADPAWTATACPGTKMLGADGKFTKDGLSCLIGKPATDQHVAIANDALTKNPTDGAKIAISAVLAAAEVCQ